MLSKKLVVVMVVALFAFGSIYAQSFKYVGAVKCKMCHNKPANGEQYNVWMKGPHAGALKVLSSPESMEIAKKKGIADPTTDAACLKCHTPVGHIDKSLIAGIKPAEGVSCESCHGPGSRYKSASIMKNRDMAVKNGLVLPTEEVCKRCHNPESPTYKPFVYDEKVALISHAAPTK